MKAREVVFEKKMLTTVNADVKMKRCKSPTYTENIIDMKPASSRLDMSIMLKDDDELYEEVNIPQHEYLDDLYQYIHKSKASNPYLKKVKKYGRPKLRLPTENAVSTVRHTMHG